MLSVVYVQNHSWTIFFFLCLNIYYFVPVEHFAMQLLLVGILLFFFGGIFVNCEQYCTFLTRLQFVHCILYCLYLPNPLSMQFKTYPQRLVGFYFLFNSWYDSDDFFTVDNIQLYYVAFKNIIIVIDQYRRIKLLSFLFQVQT